MKTVRAIVRKIDPKCDDIKEHFIDEFVEDIVRNEGQIVTLHEYNELLKYEEVSYKLKSEGDVLWHQKGNHRSFGIWKGREQQYRFDMILKICLVEPVKLDEELFKI